MTIETHKEGEELILYCDKCKSNITYDKHFVVRSFVSNPIVATVSKITKHVTTTISVTKVRLCQPCYRASIRFMKSE